MDVDDFFGMIEVKDLKSLSVAVEALMGNGQKKAKAKAKL